LVALADNTESREWRRHYNARNNIPAEHPQDSCTDYVECYFSMMQDTMRKDFTLKEVCLDEKWNYFIVYIIIIMLLDKMIAVIISYFRIIMDGERSQKTSSNK